MSTKYNNTNSNTSDCSMASDGGRVTPDPDSEAGAVLHDIIQMNDEEKMVRWSPWQAKSPFRAKA